MADRYQSIPNSSNGTSSGDISQRVVDMGNGLFAPEIATNDQKASRGVTVTTNTSAVTGNYSAIQVLEDATFSALTETGADGQAMTGFAIQAGTVLFGKFTGYTLTSGKVRAYKA